MQRLVQGESIMDTVGEQAKSFERDLGRPGSWNCCPYTRALNMRGQIFDADQAARGQYSRRHHHVAQFAHVSRPLIVQQSIDSSLMELEIRIMLRQEELGQRYDVIFSFAQRGNMQVDLA